MKKILIFLGGSLIFIIAIQIANQYRYEALVNNELYTVGEVYAVTAGSHGARYAEYNFLSKKKSLFKGSQGLISRSENFVHQVEGKKYLVIYNSNKPNISTMLFDYPIDLSDYELGDSLDSLIDKNKVVIDRWEI